MIRACATVYLEPVTQSEATKKEPRKKNISEPVSWLYLSHIGLKKNNQIISIQID
jgi:hypothetical protein